jgi:large subunit ribosomal protein L15
MEKKPVKRPAKAKAPARPAKKPAAKIKRPRRRMPAQAPQAITFGLHNIAAPAGAHKKRKYLGRGPSSGHGKTSTRGSKGQTSRAGRHFYLGFEGGQSPLIRRMPKRGFTSLFRRQFQIVNLSGLARLKDSVVTPELLQAKGLIKDKAKPVKILGEGKLAAALDVQAHAFSKRAAQEIKNAGGKVEIINEGSNVQRAG